MISHMALFSRNSSVSFFLPQSLREYIEKTNNVTWIGDGQLLWWILEKILPPKEYDSITEYRLNKKIIEKLIGTYVNSEGNLVTPSI